MLQTPVAGSLRWSQQGIPVNPPSLVARLTSYRPVLDRVIFGLAALGLLTSVHLSIQQSRGFEDGCFGFEAAPTAAFNCGAVTSSAASTFLGVSNSIWGILFHAAVAILTAGAAFAAVNRRSLLKKGRAALIGFGFIYSMYLVYYQFFELEQLCALCLTSAGIVTLMMILQVIDLTKTEPSDPSQSETMSLKPKRELAYMGAVVVLVAALVGADFVYFQPAAPPLTVETESEPAARQVADRTPISALNEALPAECQYDTDRGPVEDYSQLVNFFDPSKGNPNASVTVIEYFDPNCPHCRTVQSVMNEVMRTHGDEARFVYKPFPLWQHSIAQSEALYAAAQEGKFFEMLDHQYAIQQPSTGLSEQELRQIAQDIGMDPDALMERLESGIYRSTLLQEKQKGIDIGVNSTPTVLINGRFVSRDSRTVECLRRMIEQAAEG